MISQEKNVVAALRNGRGTRLGVGEQGRSGKSNAAAGGYRCSG
jgi:hypothetical protein